MMLRKVGLWGFLILLIVVGVGLLTFASAVDLPRPFTELVPSVGAALLIGGILGASVDRWLKARLLRDAFKSLFGYVLPEQLRAELDWVYTRELLCDRSDLTLTIRPIPDSDLMTVDIEWHRDLRNITSRTVAWLPKFTLDEWFHDGHRSRVTSLSATQDGETWEESRDHHDHPSTVERRLTKELVLKPDETITVVSEGQETRHASDAWVLNLSVATANPRVTVHAPDAICWRVNPGKRQPEQPVREIGPVTRELTGTLLPGQVIEVRWWPRTAALPGTEPGASDDERTEETPGAGGNGSGETGAVVVARPT
jgi:hypothetical protein